MLLIKASRFAAGRVLSFRQAADGWWRFRVKMQHVPLPRAARVLRDRPGLDGGKALATGFLRRGLAPDECLLLA